MLELFSSCCKLKETVGRKAELSTVPTTKPGSEETKLPGFQYIFLGQGLLAFKDLPTSIVTLHLFTIFHLTVSLWTPNLLGNPRRNSKNTPIFWKCICEDLKKGYFR